MLRVTLPILLMACQPVSETPTELTLDGWTISTHDDGSFDVTGPHSSWKDVRLVTAPAQQPDVEMRVGAFLFPEVDAGWQAATGIGIVDTWLEVGFADGTEGRVYLSTTASGQLVLDWDDPCNGDPLCVPETWRGFSAACDADEHFLGLGSHAMDVDHVGHAFPLWQSEPGIGKSQDEEPPDNWFLAGTRHASSFPTPWLIRPQQASGTLVETTARVEVDLCAADAQRWSVHAWGPAPLRLFDGERPADLVRQLTTTQRKVTVPPRWAFGAWADAIRGDQRVRDVAEELRNARAATTVLWSEDWKGATQTATGYRLSESWDIDTALYPDVPATDAWLAERGFRWFNYFAPFVGMEGATGADASANHALIQTPEGEDYVFTGVTFGPTSHLDVHGDTSWPTAKITAALDAGFDGWMADYGEWLPPDARLNGADVSNGWLAHNDVPRAWQQLNVDATAGRDTTFFCRSGWYNSVNLCPITWTGDQRTSFDADDGFPSVIPLALGLSWAGVAITTHDVGGYQSVGNDPSDKELWYRWAALGAFSPVMRTHHGSFDTDNWQFDTDDDTLAYFAQLTREHARLFPYRYALAAQAAADGTPMIRPTAWEFDGEPWDRMDAWMLGGSLLVAPVLERGATTRAVTLPAGAWYDWWTGEPATSGTFDAPLEHIPVFARAGTTTPVFDVIPDTLADVTADGLAGFAEADASRTVVLWGGGGAFTEADGTAYTPSGTPTGPGEQTARITTGDITVAGVTLQVEGTTERAYTVRVVP